jgi:hypothetical protein
MTYTAACSHCGKAIVAAATIGPEDLAPLADHLRREHPLLVIGVRTWKLKEVLRHYRIMTR